MAKEYKVKEKYYLPVTVEKVTDGNYGVTIGFDDGAGEDTTLICNGPDLLLTATEIAENIAGRRCAECSPMYEELKSRNAELEALLKEVTATRDEAIRQNNELVAENKKLKVENDEWQKTARCYSYNAIGDLELTRKLRAEIKGLKAERDDLASQLGKNLAEIQNLSSEVHFLKAQKEVKKPVHVFTNDGTEVEFRRYTDVTYRTDYNILVIKDGEEIVAGFIRGDRPGNLAYWWTE